MRKDNAFQGKTWRAKLMKMKAEKVVQKTELKNEMAVLQI